MEVRWVAFCCVRWRLPQEEWLPRVIALLAIGLRHWFNQCQGATKVVPHLPLSEQVTGLRAGQYCGLTTLTKFVEL